MPQIDLEHHFGTCSMSYTRFYEQNLKEYQTTINQYSRSDLSENNIREILVTHGFPAYAKPSSLTSDWKAVASSQYPAIQYVNNMQGLYEWVTVLPPIYKGFKPHVLHYCSATESLISSEELNFYLWFQSIYSELERIKAEISLDHDKKVGGRLYTLIEKDKLSLTLLQVTFLNIYFGNKSIYEQVMKDIGLCLTCFRPGMPKTGLGIMRFYNNFKIRHMAGKPWALYDNQKIDYTVVELCGKFVKLDIKTKVKSFTNKKDERDVHIPLNHYNRSDLCFGMDKCRCKKTK